jgi:hypothetical protein
MRHLLACALALSLPSLTLQAQTGPVDLSALPPSNHAVLMPPQVVDGPVKAPNTEREKYGEWSISGGVYFLEPVFASNPAFIVHSGGGNVSRQVDFNHRLDAAPNVWLGYVSERGWGVRFRWFEFDHGSSAGYAAAPGETVTGMSSLGLGNVPVSGTITASSRFAVNMGDLQATCNIDDAKWSYLLGIGIRYAHMSQDYAAALTNPATRIDLSSSHNLNGAGPSFALETKRRIGESGFAIYGQINGAIVFGQGNDTYTAVNNGIPQQFTRGHNDVLPIGELELGGEYQRSMGRAKLFVQAGFVGQVWWGGGNASNLDSSSNSNFGLIGLALRAGVRY